MCKFKFFSHQIINFGVRLRLNLRIKFYIIYGYREIFVEKKMFSRTSSSVILMLKHPLVVWIQVWLSHSPLGLGWSNNVMLIFSGIKEGLIFFKKFWRTPGPRWIWWALWPMVLLFGLGMVPLFLTFLSCYAWILTYIRW